MKLKYVVLFLLITTISFGISFKELEFRSEVNIVDGNNENMPFWMYSNKNGLYGKENSSISATIDINQEFDISENIDGKYRVAINEITSDSGDNNIAEIYWKLNYKDLGIKIGKFSNGIGEGLGELSSGSLLLSQNAPALHRVKLSLNDYKDLKFTNNRISIKGSISHVWLGDKRNVKNAYLHEKDFFVRLNVEKNRYIYVGISHEVIWGGDGKESSFSDFIKVFDGSGGGEDAEASEQKNSLGDHKGMYTAGIVYGFEKYKSNIYYNHFFEDGSGMRTDNLRDGLYGISLINKKNNKIKEFLFEFLESRYQSGTSPHDDGGGHDFYYHNGVYSSDWINGGFLMGTPFSLLEDGKIRHTRIKAFHLGLRGEMDKYKYKTLISKTKNFGTYTDEGKDLFKNGLDEWYFLLELKKEEFLNIDGVYFNLRLAYDTGELYSDRFSVMPGLGIERKF